MNIICYTEEDKLSEFKKLKRKKWEAFDFLMDGEWSESPYHEGDVRFYYSSTPNKKNWAIMEIGFPKRIVCVASLESPMDPIEVLARMLLRLDETGGTYIDLLNDGSDDIDYEKIYWLYRELKHQSRKK